MGKVYRNIIISYPLYFFVSLDAFILFNIFVLLTLYDIIFIDQTLVIRAVVTERKYASDNDFFVIGGEKMISEEGRQMKKEYNREYHRRNREKINSYQREYKKAHPDKIRIWYENYWNKKALKRQTENDYGGGENAKSEEREQKTDSN